MATRDNERLPPGSRQNPPPPKQQNPKAPPDTPYISVETAVPLPLVYGTHRVPAKILEKPLPTFKPGMWDQYRHLAVPRRPKNAPVTLWNFYQDRGVLYIVSQSGTTANSDTGPGGAGDTPNQGANITDGTAKFDYTAGGYRHPMAIGLCEGQIFGVRKAWQNKIMYPAYTSIPHESQFLTLGLGTPAGGRPSWTSGIYFFANPDVYGNTAVLWIVQSNGQDSDVPDLSLEVQGIFCTGAADDVSPADIAIDLLTHVRRGAGKAASFVDSTSTGAGAASWRTYCTALGFNVSWYIDSQLSTLALLRILMDATNTDCIPSNKADGSGWMLKFLPLGNVSITANGVTYTPNNTPAYNLSENDYLEPLQVSRANPIDVFNSRPVQYIERASDYRTMTVDDPDNTDVELRGLKRDDPLTLPLVMDPAAAIALARIRAQRSLNVRNTYRVRVGWRYMLLEPGDLLTLTDSLAGLNQLPVRIIEVNEDQADVGSFTFTCEEYPASVNHAAQYTPQAGDGALPQLNTNLNDLKVLPGGFVPGVVTDGSGTRGGNVDNLWPNPNSEDSAPDGSDLTAPEWAARFLDTGAFNGTWVRQISTAIHTPVRLGDKQASPAADQSQLGLSIPCVPGDAFYIEAQCRITAQGNAADHAGVYIWFLDPSGAFLGGTTILNEVATVTTWAKAAARGVAPAGTVTALVGLYCNCTAGSLTAQWDGIYVRKTATLEIMDRQGFGALRSPNYTESGGNPTAGFQLDLSGTLGAKFASSAIQIDALRFDGVTSQNFWTRLKNALGEDLATGRLFYRGNAGGVASTLAADLTIFFNAIRVLNSGNTTGVWRIGNTGGAVIETWINLWFETTQANIDGVKYMKLDWLDTSQVSLGLPYIVPFNDRPAFTDTTARTGCQCILPGTRASGTTLLALVDVTLYSALGVSSTTRRGAGGGTAPSTNLADFSVVGGGGGGGGGGCPAPWMKVRLANGAMVPAGDLYDGAVVLGFDEFRPGSGIVKPAVVLHPAKMWANRVEVALTDGRMVCFSEDHRLVTARGWQPVKFIRPGDELIGINGGVVKAAKKTGKGQVVTFKVDGGVSTYFAEGIASHNVK